MSAIVIFGQSSHATLVFPAGEKEPLGRIEASAGADFLCEMLAAGLAGIHDVGLAYSVWAKTQKGAEIDTVVRFAERKLPDDKGKRVTIEYKEAYEFFPLAEPKRTPLPAPASPQAAVWSIESDLPPSAAVGWPQGIDGLPIILATSILRPAEHHTRPPQDNDDAAIWDLIKVRLGSRPANHNILLTSADAFRRAGYRTREEASMSATVEDICSTLNGSDSEPGNRDGVPVFRHFADIFVRLRGDGVLHLWQVEPVEAQQGDKDRPKPKWAARLYYTRESNVEEWVQYRGRHYGVDAVLAACIAKWVLDGPPDRTKLSPHIGEAVERVWWLVQQGSVMPPGAKNAGKPFANWAKDLWASTTPRPKTNDKKQPKCTVEHIEVELALTRERNRWSLLEQCILKIPKPDDCWPFGVPEKNVLAAQTQVYARHVARKGYEAPWVDEEEEKKKEEERKKKEGGVAGAGGEDAAGKIPPEIKYFQLGGLKTVDRAEVEGLSGLKRLIHGYPTQLAKLEGRPEKPLCLAVFGAPGSGKSFGVTEIAKSLAGQSDASAGLLQISKRILEFNVSQFTELGDLANAMQDIREERLAGKIPVVIFDEFDSTFGGQSFGWLKYFLMPMQDGKFRNEQTIYRTGGCIMVFAGGINHNFAEFTGRQRDKEFATAKGPDFISRLRGVLNIPSMTRDDSQRFPLWQIRRAGLLHNYLESKGARMTDLRLLDALLTVGRFQHGARSLEAIIQMCDRNAQGEIDLTSLPRREQLDLHVDANEFWSLIHARGPDTPGA